MARSSAQVSSTGTQSPSSNKSDKDYRTRKLLLTSFIELPDKKEI